ENLIAAGAHAIRDDALFTVLGLHLFISAAADQSCEGADARAQERVSAHRTGDGTKSATTRGADARIFGDIRIVAGCACRLLTCGNVVVIRLLGMAAHVDDGLIISTSIGTCG